MKTKDEERDAPVQAIENLLKSIKKKQLLLIMPHPDDESVMTAGLILRARSLGWQVALLCLTKGERGKIYCWGRGRSLAEIRTQELIRAGKLLKINDLKILDYPDGRLKDLTNWHEEVAQQIRIYNPGLIVSYDPSGFSGHPDHVVTSRVVMEQVKKLAGVTLLWVCLEKRMRNKFLDPKVAKIMVPADYELILNIRESVFKSRAIVTHWCQGLWLKISIWGWFWYYRKESYAVANLSGKYDFEFGDYQID